MDAGWRPTPLCFDDFAVLYSRRSKTPLVAVERLTRQQLADLLGVSTLILYPAIALVLLGLSCGMVGSLVVANRMAFFSDAMAHTAFAGVAFGLLSVIVFAGVGSTRAVDEYGVEIALVMVAVGLAAGFGILLYVVAWIIIPEAPEGDQAQSAPPARDSRPSHGSRIVFGTILVALGILLLVDWVVPMRQVVWPLALIVIGLGVLAYGARR